MNSNYKIAIEMSISPLHLVKFTSTTGGAISYTRYDSDKEIILDPLPTGVDAQQTIEKVKELLGVNDGKN